MRKRYGLRDWWDVNFYPMGSPPTGKVCKAINVMRQFVGLPHFDFSRQDLIRKPEQELSLKEAEEVEEWVDESREYQWKYSWTEIDQFDKERSETMEGFVDHFCRIGHAKGVQPEDHSATYYYKQNTAKQFFESSVKYGSITLVLTFLVVLGLLDHAGSLSALVMALGNGIRAATWWTVDVAAPLLFVGTTAFGAGRWSYRRLKRRNQKLLSEKTETGEKQ
jgi:uncharacterized membrane protein YphA (DoxX/SURF4 family)